MAGKKNITTGYYGLFNDSFPPIIDGVTLTVENYAHWLLEGGRIPCVVTPWNPERGLFPYDVERYFSLPIRSRKPYRYGYPKLDPFIWRKLRKRPFRIVHSHCPFSSGRLGVYVKKKQGVPLIGTFHSKYESDLKHSFKLMPWCVPIIMRRILAFFNACDEVWIPQAAVAETVREYGYKGKLEVVDNGIDYADFHKSDLYVFRDRSRQELGIPPSSLSLLFVGQHIWEKGIGIILEALRDIKGDVDFKMNFVGTGYAAGELAELIDRYGLSDKVTLRGVERDREKLSKYYAASDLFLFPSFYDNAPLVVREAAALGVPAIVPDGSTASEVIVDGINGYLSGKDAKGLAQTLRRLAKEKENLRQIGVEAGRTLVRSWQDVVEEVSDRYESLIKRHQR